MPKQTDSIELTNSLQGTVEYTASQEIIPEEKILEQGSFTYTSNGERTENPSEGYDGFSQVAVNVNVQPTLQSKSVSYTENDSYTVEPDDGYQGLSSVAVNVNVPQGGGDENYEGAVFYDYDGTELYRFSKSEVAAMTELPPLPTQTGLICQEWNWSLANIKSQVANYDYCEIGATYTTDDGRTRLYVRLRERLSPCIGMYFDGAGSCDVDWGDGSPHTTFSGSSTTVYSAPHTYSASGEYVISIGCTGNCKVPTISEGSGLISTADSNQYNLNVSYRSTVYKIEIGANIVDVYTGRGLGGFIALENITLPNTFILNRTHSYTFVGDNNLSCLILPNASPIPSYMFYESYSISKVVPSQNTPYLGSYAFAYTYSLKSFVVPNVTIPEYLFQYSKIGVAILSGNNPVYQSFGACNNLRRITKGSYVYVGENSFANNAVLDNVKLNDNVTGVGNYAFNANYSLKNIQFPARNYTIGNYAFSSCRSLMNVDLSDCTSIGESAFQNCVALSSVTLGEGLTTIKTQAFHTCAPMDEITIPSTVTSIGSRAFFNNSLKKIVFKGTTPPVLAASDTFTPPTTDCIIYVPSGSLSAYTTATNYPNPSTYTYVEY